MWLQFGNRGRVVLIAIIALLLVVPASAASGGNPSNPFVGAWESMDPAPDNSHVRLQISQTGKWHLRDDAGSVCRNNDLGFVPATASGHGEFDGTVHFWLGEFDIYCYPRDGQGRQYVFTVPPGDPFHYREGTDVMIASDGICWWRSGKGSPADCAGA